MVIHWLQQLSNQKKRRLFVYLFGAMLPFLIAQTAQAATNSKIQQGVSAETILAVIVGLVISGFYLRGMYLVLHYASETYDVKFDFVQDDGNKSRNGLIIGSFLLVILSALIISSYGWTSLFLYIGPILCLLGPIVVIVSMEIDLQKYRQALRSKELDVFLKEKVAHEVGDGLRPTEGHREFNSQAER